MKYKDEILVSEQIRMRDFRFLPGYIVRFWPYSLWWGFYEGEVVEVGFANPEYVLGGPGAENAGVLLFKAGQRKECLEFLQSHMNAKVKLEKSMWAVVEYRKREYLPRVGFLPCVGKEKWRKAYYTYDIEKMVRAGSLAVVGGIEIDFTP